jgi:hypothetical protein
MKKLIGLSIAVCCLGVVLGVLWAGAENQSVAVDQKRAAVTQPVFVCPECHAVALKTGKCARCQKDLVERRVPGVKVE